MWQQMIEILLTIEYKFMIKEGKNRLSQAWILLFIWVLLVARGQACDPGCGNCVIYSSYCRSCLGNY